MAKINGDGLAPPHGPRQPRSSVASTHSGFRPCDWAPVCAAFLTRCTLLLVVLGTRGSSGFIATDTESYIVPGRTLLHGPSAGRSGNQPHPRLSAFRRSPPACGVPPGGHRTWRKSSSIASAPGSSCASPASFRDPPGLPHLLAICTRSNSRHFVQPPPV